MGRDFSELRQDLAFAAIRRLGSLTDDLVLVGGQAVAVWADRYLARSEFLTREEPFATKDIDFVGTFDQAEQCARLLGGVCKRFTFGQRTPCTAIVRTPEPDAVQVDFLRVPLGFTDPAALKARSLVYDGIRIMHPMDMLRSRTINVGRLPQYQEERSVNQLRAAVVCVREFARDMLDQVATHPEAVRQVLKLNEEIFSLAQGDDAVRVHAAHRVDVLDAHLTDPRLPEAFASTRVPQVHAQVKAKRDLFARIEARKQKEQQPESSRPKRRGR